MEKSHLPGAVLWPLKDKQETPVPAIAVFKNAAKLPIRQSLLLEIIIHLKAEAIPAHPA